MIISDLEHNAVYRVVDALARQGLITYSVAETCPSDEKMVWNFEHLIRPNTRLIVCTQGSNVFGVRVPGGEDRRDGAPPRGADGGGRRADGGASGSSI